MGLSGSTEEVVGLRAGEEKGERWGERGEAGRGQITQDSRLESKGLVFWFSRLLFWPPRVGCGDHSSLTRD